MDALTTTSHSHWHRRKRCTERHDFDHSSLSPRNPPVQNEPVSAQYQERSKTHKVLNHYLRVGSPADSRHTHRLTGELFTLSPISFAERSRALLKLGSCPRFGQSPTLIRSRNAICSIVGSLGCSCRTTPQYGGQRSSRKAHLG